MKKSIFKLLLLALAVPAVISSCKDERNNFMVDDSIAFRNTESGEMTSLSVFEEEFELVILKGGKGMSGATVVISPSETALKDYNEENGTGYVLLPSSAYNLSASELTFAKGDISKNVKVTWDNAVVGALGNDKDYVIALELSVKGNALEVSEGKNVVLYRLAWPYLSMETNVAPETGPSASRELPIYNGTIEIDYPVNIMDITVNYAIDYSLIDAYNSANGTNYTVPLSRYNVALAAGSSTIPAGETSTSFTLNFDSSPLFNGKELVEIDYGRYLVPVRITSVSSDAVGLAEDIMYIPVVMHRTVMGPWTVLEGEDNCYAKDPNDGANWTLVYTTDRLFDGDTTTEWISLWETPNTFPMEFVVDMHQARVFTKFYIGDHGTMQGQYRDYEIYTAETYNGTGTNWNLVASGMRDYDWTAGGKIYDYPVSAMIAGRYLKFVIVQAQNANEGDYIHQRGKLTEVYGEGF